MRWEDLWPASSILCRPQTQASVPTVGARGRSRQVSADSRLPSTQRSQARSLRSDPKPCRSQDLLALAVGAPAKSFACPLSSSNRSYSPGNAWTKFGTGGRPRIDVRGLGCLVGHGVWLRVTDSYFSPASTLTPTSDLYSPTFWLRPDHRRRRLLPVGRGPYTAPGVVRHGRKNLTLLLPLFPKFHPWRFFLSLSPESGIPIPLHVTSALTRGMGHGVAGVITVD